MPLILRVASFALIAGAVACSGAAQQEVEMAAPASPATSSGGGGTTASPSNDAGSVQGTGEPVTPSEDSGSSTFGSPAPQTCPAGGVVESGGNDSESSAQDFTTIGCGTLLPGASDWWRFRLPAIATKLAINFSGKVTLAATAEGTTTEIGSGGSLPFHPTAEYDIQVTSSHSQAEAYVILVETN